MWRAGGWGRSPQPFLQSWQKYPGFGKNVMIIFIYGLNLSLRSGSFVCFRSNVYQILRNFSYPNKFQVMCLLCSWTGFSDIKACKIILSRSFHQFEKKYILKYSVRTRSSYQYALLFRKMFLYHCTLLSICWLNQKHIF